MRQRSYASGSRRSTARISIPPCAGPTRLGRDPHTGGDAEMRVGACPPHDWSAHLFRQLLQLAWLEAAERLLPCESCVQLAEVDLLRQFCEGLAAAQGRARGIALGVRRGIEAGSGTMAKTGGWTCQQSRERRRSAGLLGDATD